MPILGILRVRFTGGGPTEPDPISRSAYVDHCGRRRRPPRIPTASRSPTRCMWSGARSPGPRPFPPNAWARRRAQVLGEIAAVRLPPRRCRVNLRVVKRKMSNWHRKRGRPQLPVWRDPVSVPQSTVLGLGLPALCDSGHLPPHRGGVARGPDGGHMAGRRGHPRHRAAPRRRVRPLDFAGRPRGRDGVPARRGPLDGARRDEEPRPAPDLQRQPVLRSPIHDPHVSARLPGSLPPPRGGAPVAAAVFPLVQHGTPAQRTGVVALGGGAPRRRARRPAAPGRRPGGGLRSPPSGMGPAHPSPRPSRTAWPSIPPRVPRNKSACMSWPDLSPGA